MQLKAGVEFVGNPDEVVLATNQTVYEAIPDEAQDWKYFFDRLVGHSQAGKYWKKGDLWNYVLNVWAEFFLPRYTYVGNIFFQAAHYFLLADDLRPNSNLDDDDLIGYWEVSATGIWRSNEIEPGDPCFQRSTLERGTYRYWGRRPVLIRAEPYPAPCKSDREYHELRRKGEFVAYTSEHAWILWKSVDVATYWCLGGGIEADVTTLEVTEGGLLYVSLPQLPDNVPPPPPLIGRVVDYGLPGPQGPPGPTGPQGPPGESPVGDDLVNLLCALNPAQLDNLQDCLEIPQEQPNYLAMVLGATPLEVQAAQQVIIETAPEVVLPHPEVILTEEGLATMEATALPSGGWSLTLLLPIALLIGAKMLTESIQVLECDENGLAGPHNIPFPVWSFEGHSQLLVYQELFNQLGWLLRCCPPCESNTWEILTTVTGDFILADLVDVSAVRLVMRSNPAPEVNAWYGKMNVHKFGLVRWLYDDHIHPHIGQFVPRESTLLFWNSNDQVFEVPNGNVFGFRITQEYGKEYEIWVRRFQHFSKGLDF